MLIIQKIILDTMKLKRNLGPYYESKLELKSNSSKILPVNCKFTCYSTPT